MTDSEINLVILMSILMDSKRGSVNQRVMDFLSLIKKLIKKVKHCLTS